MALEDITKKEHKKAVKILVAKDEWKDLTYLGEDPLRYFKDFFRLFAMLKEKTCFSKRRDNELKYATKTEVYRYQGRELEISLERGGENIIIEHIRKANLAQDNWEGSHPSKVIYKNLTVSLEGEGQTSILSDSRNPSDNLSNIKNFKNTATELIKIFLSSEGAYTLEVRRDFYLDRRKSRGRSLGRACVKRTPLKGLHKFMEMFSDLYTGSKVQQLEEGIHRTSGANTSYVDSRAAVVKHTSTYELEGRSLEVEVQLSGYGVEENIFSRFHPLDREVPKWVKHPKSQGGCRLTPTYTVKVSDEYVTFDRVGDVTDSNLNRNIPTDLHNSLEFLTAKFLGKGLKRYEQTELNPLPYLLHQLRHLPEKERTFSKPTGIMPLTQKGDTFAVTSLNRGQSAITVYLKHEGKDYKYFEDLLEQFEDKPFYGDLDEITEEHKEMGLEIEVTNGEVTAAIELLQKGRFNLGGRTFQPNGVATGHEEASQQAFEGLTNKNHWQEWVDRIVKVYQNDPETPMSYLNKLIRSKFEFSGGSFIVTSDIIVAATAKREGLQFDEDLSLFLHYNGKDEKEVKRYEQGQNFRGITPIKQLDMSKPLSQFGEWRKDISFSILYSRMSPGNGEWTTSEEYVESTFSVDFSQENLQPNNIICDEKGNGLGGLQEIPGTTWRTYIDQIAAVYNHIAEQEEIDAVEENIEETIKQIFPGQEGENILKSVNEQKASLKSRGQYASIPRLCLGAIELPAPGQKNIAHDQYTIQGAQLLVSYLTALKVWDEEEAARMVTQRVVNNLMPEFQRSPERAAEILEQLSTSPEIYKTA